jgi:transposase
VIQAPKLELRIMRYELTDLECAAIAPCRRVATRYDKLAANYLAFIQLASIRLWLRVNESAP